MRGTDSLTKLHSSQSTRIQRKEKPVSPPARLTHQNPPNPHPHPRRKDSTTHHVNAVMSGGKLRKSICLFNTRISAVQAELSAVQSMRRMPVTDRKYRHAKTSPKRGIHHLGTADHRAVGRPYPASLLRRRMGFHHRHLKTGNHRDRHPRFPSC